MPSYWDWLPWEIQALILEIVRHLHWKDWKEEIFRCNCVIRSLCGPHDYKAFPLPKRAYNRKYPGLRQKSYLGKHVVARKYWHNFCPICQVRVVDGHRSRCWYRGEDGIRRFQFYLHWHWECWSELKEGKRGHMSFT